MDKKPHIFSSDKPIKSSNEDLLNRYSFSKELGKSLSNWSESESLVVGLYGKWGEGKTSVKNMLIEELKASKDSQIEVLEFNPWQWSHKENLLESFFTELIRALSKSDEKESRELVEKLSDYLEYLKLADEFLTKVRTNLKAIFVILAFVIGLLSFKVSEDYSLIFIFVAVTLLIFSQSLKVLNWFLSFYLRWKKIGLKSKNLEEKKFDISELLRKLHKTLLVIIDDVDRLRPEEVKNLFTLIKANADFPNLVYLTMFQRDIVEKSLEDSGIFSGSEYLEKIVQVGIDLPDIPPEGIHQILFTRLNEVLDEYGGDKNFDSGRWSELFVEGIGIYFKNLRDVNRFISSLSFQMGALCRNKVLEVNAIDLIGVEVLRHFESNVYRSLFENKKLLTQSAPSGMRNYTEAKDKEVINRIFELASSAGKEKVKTIIKVLFPNVQWTWSNYYSSVDDRDFRNLRICHPDRFNRYFSFFMTPQDFNQYEFEAVLESTADSQKLLGILMDYNKEGRLAPFLEKFESYKQEVPAENANSFLSAMFALGEVMSDEHKGFFQFSSLLSVERIILWYLKKKEFIETRRDVFKKAIESTTGISLPIIKLHDEYNRRSDDKYPDHYSFSIEDKDLIKEMVLLKINQNKDSQAFAENIHLPRLFLIWKSFEEEKASEWLLKHVESDEAFIRFLKMLISKSFSSTGYTTKTNHYLRLFSLKQFFADPEQIFNRVKKLKEKPEFNIASNEVLFKVLVKTEDEFHNPEKYPDEGSMRFRDYEDDDE